MLCCCFFIFLSFIFFFNDTATTEIYTLSLHDALPISVAAAGPAPRRRHAGTRWWADQHSSPLLLGALTATPTGAGRPGPMLLICGGGYPRVVCHGLSRNESTGVERVITWRPTPRPGSAGNSNSEEPASVALRGTAECRRLDGGRRGGSLSSSRAALPNPATRQIRMVPEALRLAPLPTGIPRASRPEWCRSANARRRPAGIAPAGQSPGTAVLPPPGASGAGSTVPPGAAPRRPARSRGLHRRPWLLSSWSTSACGASPTAWAPDEPWKPESGPQPVDPARHASDPNGS